MWMIDVPTTSPSCPSTAVHFPHRSSTTKQQHSPIHPLLLPVTYFEQSHRLQVAASILVSASEDGRRPSCCLQAPAFQSPNPNHFAVTWRSGMSVYGLLLGFFPPLFIHICRIEFTEQNHSFSLFWSSTGGNGGTGGLWGRVGVFFTAAARSVLLFHLEHHHEIIKCAFWKNRVQPSPWRQLIKADLPFSAALTKKNLNEVKWW